jgi:hypothetical protein
MAPKGGGSQNLFTRYFMIYSPLGRDSLDDPASSASAVSPTSWIV